MHYFIALLSIVFYSLAFAQPESSTGLLDDFNRAGPAVGSTWTNTITGSGNGCEIYSNKLYEHISGLGGGCYYNDSTFSEEQEAFATLVDADTYSSAERMHPVLICLHDGIGTTTVDGYALSFQKRDAEADRLTIRRIVNGNFQDIGSFHAIEMSSGDRVGLRNYANGTLEVFVDQGSGWVNLFTRGPSDNNYIDYTCTSSYMGVFLVNPTHNIDDFGGGNFSESGTSAAGRGGFFMFQ